MFGTNLNGCFRLLLQMKQSSINNNVSCVKMTQGAPLQTVAVYRFDKAHEEDVDKAHHEGGALGEFPSPE